MTSVPGRRAGVPEGSPPTELGIGERLRNVREARRLSLDDVEAATRIRGRYLEALEDEAFDRLPAPAYARAFLSSYASYLGLQRDEVAGMISGLAAASHRPSGAPGGVRIQPVVRRSRGRRILAVATLAVAVGLAVVAYTQYGQLHRFVITSAPGLRGLPGAPAAAAPPRAAPAGGRPGSGAGAGPSPGGAGVSSVEAGGAVVQGVASTRAPAAPTAGAQTVPPVGAAAVGGSVAANVVVPSGQGSGSAPSSAPPGAAPADQSSGAQSGTASTIATTAPPPPGSPAPGSTAPPASGVPASGSSASSATGAARSAAAPASHGPSAGSAPGVAAMDLSAGRAVRPGGRAASPSAAPAMSGVRLVVAATGRSWLRVVADGVTVFAGFLDRGEQRTWRAGRRLSVRIGNAGAVRLTVNGRVLGAVGGEGEVVDETFAAGRP